MPVYRIRVSRPIISHLEGSHAWQCPRDTDYSDAVSLSLMAKLKSASVRDDGSVFVLLGDDERDALRSYTEVQAIGAKDNIVSPRDIRRWPALAEGNTVGEYNACMALMRRLDKITGIEARVERLCSHG